MFAGWGLGAVSFLRLLPPLVKIGSAGWNRTTYLRVMSPTSYQCSTHALNICRSFPAVRSATFQAPFRFIQKRQRLATTLEFAPPPIYVAVGPGLRYFQTLRYFCDGLPCVRFSVTPGIASINPSRISRILNPANAFLLTVAGSRCVFSASL